MLRNEIQNKTGLTRKAIEYYEERGLIKPQKSNNGYRNYSEEDLEILMQVSLYRKLSISLNEIEEILSSGRDGLASILRNRQRRLEMDEKRKNILEMIIKGEEQNLINEQLDLIEKEESIYERLERVFPGYFGQMIFSAYQPFLNEPLQEDGQIAYKDYIKFLDDLPSFKLSNQERVYVEQISSYFDMNDLKEVNNKKREAINNPKKWFKENEKSINKYLEFKNSEEYSTSLLKQIENKIQKFMIDNKYYEIAIPLIRKFSRSYDEYYKKLLEANNAYMDDRL